MTGRIRRHAEAQQPKRTERRRANTCASAAATWKLYRPFCGTKRDNIYTVSGKNDGRKTTSETISRAPRHGGGRVGSAAGGDDRYTQNVGRKREEGKGKARRGITGQQDAGAMGKGSRTKEREREKTAQIKQLSSGCAAMEEEMAEERPERGLGREEIALRFECQVERREAGLAFDLRLRNRRIEAGGWG